MAAYWYLICADQLHLEVSKEDFEEKKQDVHELVPDTFKNSFELLERKEYVREAFLSGDKTVRIPKIGFNFILKKDYFEKHKSFLIDSWQIIKELTRNGPYDYFSENIDAFITDLFTPLVINHETIDSIDRELAGMYGNYYLRYWSIPRIIVYHGWPGELVSNSVRYSLAGFHLFHSMEKMGIMPEELVFITGLQQKIAEQLSDRYEQAKHLYILGF